MPSRPGILRSVITVWTLALIPLSASRPFAA